MAGIVPLDNRAQPLAFDQPDARAAFLHRYHQRDLVQRGPDLAEPEPRAGLRVSCYARRIVVSSAGDEPRTQQTQKMPQLAGASCPVVVIAPTTPVKSMEFPHLLIRPEPVPPVNM